MRNRKTGGCLAKVSHCVRNSLFLAIVLGTLLNALFIFGSIRDSERVNPEDNNQGNTERGNPKLKQPFIEWIFEHPADVATVLIAAFNGLLVYVTIRLVDSTNKLWDVTRATLNADIQSKLPFLVVSKLYPRANIDVLYRDPRVVRVDIAFKNYGDSPAEVTDYLIACFFNNIKNRPEPSYDVAVKCGPGDVIESGEEWNKYIDISFYNHDIAALREGRAELWVYGYIAFNDIFGVRNQVGFCFFGKVIELGDTIAVEFVHRTDIPATYVYRKRETEPQSAP
jgi:hypothetical protein